KRRCWWRESNPQGLSPGDVRSLCVYQFRHTSTSPAANLGKPEGQDAEPRKSCRTATSGCSSAVTRAVTPPCLPGRRHIPSPVDTLIPDTTERAMSPEALEQELDQLHPAAFGWALACCSGDRAAAEDALQASYLKVLDGRASDGRPDAVTELVRADGTRRLTEALATLPRRQREVLHL